MAKTETQIDLKINKGTYANIKANLNSIQENELIITTDKNIPVPDTTDSDDGKVLIVDNSDYVLQQMKSDDVDDTSQTNKFVTQAMYDYLDNILYQAPTIASFSLVGYVDGVARQGISGNFEAGTSITVNSFNHQETNVANISGNLTFDSQSVSPSASATSVSLTTPLTITSNTSKTLSGTDTKGNPFSRTVSMSFYYYTYTLATSSVISSGASVSGATKSSKTVSQFASSGDTISYSNGDYIYFFTKGTGKTVQQQVLGQWTNIATTYVGEVTLTLSNSTTATYDCYRIGTFNASGSDLFRV